PTSLVAWRQVSQGPDTYLAPAVAATRFRTQRPGKMFGSSCARIGCQTGFSNPSTISSTTAATPGTRSSISPGRLCPSRAAIGQVWVTQCEDWYKLIILPKPGPNRIRAAGQPHRDKG